MQREEMVSFLDFSSSAGGLEGNKGERCSNLKRMGRSNSILSGGYWRDSHGSVGEDIRGKFSNAPAEAAGVTQYKLDMVPQPNGRWGSQICEKRQRVWPGSFNGEDETAKAISAFKLGGRDAVTESKSRQEVAHLETRVLSVHSKGETVADMFISKRTYDEEPGNSKNINKRRTCSAETLAVEEERDLKGAERIYSPGGGEPDDKKASLCRREHMFEKAVTPSDVGKLNRLVIPKQQAEKYFPLADTDANEKGPLLNFEDSAGKTWRFRYSYWNSSQSYVLTKGWSRFVKEKKLDAGDIVSFDRATHQDPDSQRFFISCRRKSCNLVQPTALPGSIKFSSHAQQIISSRALIWPANNIGGESCRSAAETRGPQANAQPVDLLTSLHFITTGDRPRKGIHDTALPFSIQRSSNTSGGCGRPAMDTESSVRAPPLDAIQLKSRGMSRDDLSQTIENKIPEAAATSFDHSTSKKVLRLFGVDLECGKVDHTYEDGLLIIPPSERLFPRNSKYYQQHDQGRH